MTELVLMMRIDPLALIFGLRECVTVVNGTIVALVIPDVQVEAYRHSDLYVNLVSVMYCSVLNWVKQRELRGLASDNRLFGRIAEPGWEVIDLNNSFKCRMSGESLSIVQFNPKLTTNHQGTKDAVKIPTWSQTYAHLKENQDTWLAGSDSLPDRRMLLGVTSPVLASRIGAAQDVEEKSEGIEPRFISWNAAALQTFDFTFPDLWSGR